MYSLSAKTNAKLNISSSYGGPEGWTIATNLSLDHRYVNDNAFRRSGANRLPDNGHASMGSFFTKLNKLFV
ncbi:hypothetical protein [Alkalihalobacterium elongatum]|uniref:hypothetical protein n=1 Tax=Alkalihalobacterium elongatum TaxID=2675466 RepID=UPI001C1F71EA|nr:hypothetical protein [Alkalihalobacterium elongatum]